MTAFVLACYLGTVSSGSIYFKNVNDCVYYADNLSGQVLETEDGSQRYECMCKLVPQEKTKKVKVY